METTMQQIEGGVYAYVCVCVRASVCILVRCVCSLKVYILHHGVVHNSCFFHYCFHNARFPVRLY